MWFGPVADFLRVPQTCITTLAVRNLVRPFANGVLEQACPITDILRELADSLQELQDWKDRSGVDLAPA